MLRAGSVQHQEQPATCELRRYGTWALTGGEAWHEPPFASSQATSLATRWLKRLAKDSDEKRKEGAKTYSFCKAATVGAPSLDTLKDVYIIGLYLVLRKMDTFLMQNKACITTMHDMSRLKPAYLKRNKTGSVSSKLQEIGPECRAICFVPAV